MQNPTLLGNWTIVIDTHGEEWVPQEGILDPGAPSEGLLFHHKLKLFQWTQYIPEGQVDHVGTSVGIFILALTCVYGP